MIRSNQIKNFPMIVQDIEVVQKVWGKNISALKGKTTRINPNLVSRYQVKIPIRLVKLHKEFFLTWDIFFVEKSLYS